MGTGTCFTFSSSTQFSNNKWMFNEGSAAFIPGRIILSIGVMFVATDVFGVMSSMSLFMLCALRHSEHLYPVIERKSTKEITF